MTILRARGRSVNLGRRGSAPPLPSYPDPDELARLDEARIDRLRLEELEELAERFGRGPIRDSDLYPQGWS